MAELPVYKSQIQQSTSSVAPALSGISASQQGEAMLSQSLQNKLGAFFETSKAIAKPIIEEKAYGEALSAEEYTRKSRWTMYGQAYNEAADAKYASDGALEARMKAAELAAANPYNPNAFAQQFQAAMKPQVEAAPTAALKVALQKSYNDYGARQYEKLLNASLKKARDNQSKSYAGYAEMLRSDYLAAVANNDQEAAVDVMSNLMQLQNSAITNQFVSEGDVASFNRTLITDAYSTREMSAFNDSTNQLQYMTDFRQRDHAPLNEEQQDKLYAKMMQSIRSDNALQNSMDMEEQRLREEERQNKIDEFNERYIRYNLTQGDIDYELSQGTINLTDYEKYSTMVSDMGPRFTNTESVLRITTYFSDYTQDDIFEASDIKNDDKVRLIKERKAYLEREGKWTNTIQGSEARDRVRRKFNILSDTLMSKIDFTGKTMREFDQTYRAFFDKVQQLPMEEREMNALRIADEVIAEYDNRKAADKKANAERRKAEEEEKQRLAEEASKNKAWARFTTSIGKIMSGDPDAADR